MCNCTQPPRLQRTEKHCDRVVFFYTDGRTVTKFLRRS